MKLRFHPEALVEFQEAARYYQRQQPGLGERFTRAVESALSRIGEMPQAGRVIDGKVRRQLTRILPYAVLYTLETRLHPDRGCHAQPPRAGLLAQTRLA